MTERRIKLSATQLEIMKWLGKGWTAYRSNGTNYMVNGKKLCTVASLLPLETAGLITKGIHGEYDATDAGRELTKELRL